MKYELNKKTVSAIYDDTGTLNPFIDALPSPLSVDEFYRAIQHLPPVRKITGNQFERKRALSTISSLFVPMDYMYSIYDSVFRLITSSYYTTGSRDSAKKISESLATEEGSYSEQAQSSSLLGTPGIGKTTTLKRCLSLIPQVIEHETYLNMPCYRKQVLWLFIQCPSDANQKTAAFNIVRALDNAVNSDHLDYFTKTKSGAASTAATYIKVLCQSYQVGMIVIDEIQNVIINSERTKRVKALIRFLTELTNDTSTSVYFVGTTSADDVFVREEYLKRRTRGPRLLPFRPDGAYREFLETIWPYQFTSESVPLTDKMASQIYDYSGGIPAYITKLFEEAQAQAFLQGLDSINSKLITDAAKYLSITPPKTLGTGTHLSDFKVSVGGKTEEVQMVEEAKRLYVNKRGRKKAQRDPLDLIVALKEKRLPYLLKKYHLYEEIVLC